jgi:hypothetical protein
MSSKKDTETIIIETTINSSIKRIVMSIDEIQYLDVYDKISGFQKINKQNEKELKQYIHDYSDYLNRYKYTYEYIYSYFKKSQDENIKKQIKCLSQLIKQNNELCNGNLDLQHKYCHLMSIIDDNTKIDYDKKNIMKEIFELLIKHNNLIFKSFCNRKQISSERIKENERSFIIDNIIWCDISLSIILNLFQKYLFDFLIKILENNVFYMYGYRFIYLITACFDQVNVSKSMKIPVVIQINNELKTLANFIYHILKFCKIDILPCLNITQIDVDNETKEDYRLNITTMMVYKFINYLYISSYIESNILVDIYNKMLELHNIYKTKKGGKSKQIIKTKKRISVRYENVKYKRTILIKNNKRYVKINKRLVAI